jgi:hypothetical protein
MGRTAGPRWRRRRPPRPRSSAPRGPGGISGGVNSEQSMVSVAAEGFQSSGISNRTQLHTALLYTAAHSCTQLHTYVHNCVHRGVACWPQTQNNTPQSTRRTVRSFRRPHFGVARTSRGTPLILIQSIAHLVARLARGLDRLPPAGERGASAARADPRLTIVNCYLVVFLQRKSVTASKSNYVTFVTQ